MKNDSMKSTLVMIADILAMILSMSVVSCGDAEIMTFPEIKPYVLKYVTLARCLTPDQIQEFRQGDVIYPRIY